MKNLFIYIVPMVILASCSQPSEPVTDASEGEEKQTISVVDTADVKESGDGIECTGEINVPVNAKISIHSPIKGILKAINVLEGEKVTKGQVLGSLQHIEIIKIQEEYLKSKAQFQFWKGEFERKSTLHQQNVIPDKEFQQVEASYQSEKAMFESLKKQINLLGLSESKLAKGEISESIALVSPINGYVTMVHANKGMFIDQDTKIFELVDVTHKHVHLSVFASDISRVKIGQEIRFRMAGGNEEFLATVHLIGKSVESGNKAISIHGHLLEENDDLVIGTQVFATIKTE